VVIAVLASYLAKELTAAGGRLVARDAHIRRLLTLQDQIVAAMPSGLITFDDAGRITFINPAAEMILGVDRPMAGESIEKVLPGATQVKPSTRRAELSTQTPDGPKVLGLAVTPLQGTGGAALVVFQDLTGLRKAEEQLRTSDHLASLGRLSAQLAHEIRNPLASMRGAAQMLADEAPPSGASSRLSGILVRESDRLARLVEDFLKFSRPAAPVFASLELFALAQETIEMLRTDPLAASVDLGLEGPRVRATADEAQLRQVLINLIRNALVAAGPGGRVRVRVRDDEGRAQISVWDSAGKIPATELGRIFEPFYTTRDGGTGLGLSTAHSIINAHGGSIAVSSSLSAGTEFVVSLPEAHVASTDRR
jgi:two-component system sensor histidine kinase PilS (NtrC family)